MRMNSSLGRAGSISGSSQFSGHVVRKAVGPSLLAPRLFRPDVSCRCCPNSCRPDVCVCRSASVMSLGTNLSPSGNDSLFQFPVKSMHLNILLGHEVKCMNRNIFLSSKSTCALFLVLCGYCYIPVYPSRTV